MHDFFFFNLIYIYLDSCLAILNPHAVETEGDKNDVESELKKDIEAAISSRVDESGQSKFVVFCITVQDILSYRKKLNFRSSFFKSRHCIL